MVGLQGGERNEDVSPPVPGQFHAARRTRARRDDGVPGHPGPEGQRLTAATSMDGGPPPPEGPKLQVLRLCSVFEAPAATLAVGGAAYDPVGGMQSHTGQLTRALDACGVAQTVVTAWRPGAARRERLGIRSQVLRVGAPVRRLRQLYAPTAAPLLPGGGRRWC
jgi:hypothetical protein